MSFSDPGFGSMTFDELRTWLSNNDLSAADYDELLNQLTVDLPTSLPGVVQSSIGGSSASISQPSEGTGLQWDATQQLYVPTTIPFPTWSPYYTSVEYSGAGAAGVCPYGTVIGGDSAAWTLGTNAKWTAPWTGAVHISVAFGITASASSRYILSIIKNGSEASGVRIYDGGGWASGYISTSGSAIIPVTAGDYIQAGCIYSTGSPTWISYGASNACGIHRVG